MSKDELANKAADLYRTWHNFDPDEVINIDIPVPKGNLQVLGPCTRLDYISNKWKKNKPVTYYYHDWQKNEPMLMTDDKNNLFLAGNIKVTDLGIDDWDEPQSNAVKPKKPSEVVTKLGELELVQYTDELGNVKTISFSNENRFFVADPKANWCYISSDMSSNPRKPKNPLRLGEIGTIGDLVIVLVNGKFIRNEMNVDFTQGGHHYVYPEMIPDNEMWIDNANYEEREYIIQHEYKEYTLMKDGMDYNTAHDQANIIERRLRKGMKNKGHLFISDNACSIGRNSSRCSRPNFTSQDSSLGDSSLGSIDNKYSNPGINTYLKNPENAPFQHTYRVPMSDNEAMKAIKFLQIFSGIGVYADPDPNMFAHIRLTISGWGDFPMPKEISRYRHDYEAWKPFGQLGRLEEIEYKVLRAGKEHDRGAKIAFRGNVSSMDEVGYETTVPVKGEIYADAPLPADPILRKDAIQTLIEDEVDSILDDMVPNPLRQQVHDILRKAHLPLDAIRKGHAQYEQAMQALVEKLPWDMIQKIDSAMVRNPRMDDQLYEDLLRLSIEDWIMFYEDLLKTCKRRGFVITDDAINIDVLRNIHSHYIEYVKARYHPMEIAAKVIKEITASKPREDRKRDLPFGDGNRRTSVKIATSILDICNYKLKVSDAHAQRFRDEVRKLSEEEVIKFLKNHCIASSNPRFSSSQRLENSRTHLENSSSDIR